MASTPGALPRALTFLLVLSSSLIGCTKQTGHAVNDTYKFPSAEGASSSALTDVNVQVNIDYRLATGSGPTIALTNPNYVLNAYLPDSGNEQVALAYDGQAPIDNLPVVLTGTQLSFTAVVAMPSNVQPGPNGYNLHFTLTPASGSSLKLSTSTDPTSLETIAAGVQPSTAASSNAINLSLASTLTYQMATASGLTISNTSSVTAYSSLLAIITAQLTTVEGTVNSGAQTTLTTYAEAVVSAVKYQVMQDQTLQSKIVTALQPAVPTTSSQSGQSVLASSFTSLLQSFATDVAANLGTASNAQVQVFKSGTINASTVPNPATYSSVIFEPVAVTFTDTDASPTLGGGIVITPPTNVSGIDSYNVYFGGSTAASARLKLAGNVKQGVSPLQVVLPAGTAVPTGASYFWVFPVSGGKELALSKSVAIVNAGGPGAPASFAITSAVRGNTQVVLTWPAASGASSYTIKRGTVSGTYSTTVSTSATSPYTDTGVDNATTYYYMVTAVNSLGSTNAITEAVVQAPHWAGTQRFGTAAVSLQPYGMATDSAGNVYITGSTPGTLNTIPNTGTNDAFVIKMDKYRNVVWTKLITGGSSTTTYGTALVVDSSGYIYLTGSTSGIVDGGTSTTGDTDLFLAKLDSSGTAQWIKQLGGATGSTVTRGDAIARDSAGNIVVAADTFANLTGSGATEPHIYLVVFDPTGTKLHDLEIGNNTATSGGAQTLPSGVAFDSADNVIVVGTTNCTTLLSQTTYGYRNALIAKFPPTLGTPTWAVLYSAPTYSTAVITGSGLALASDDSIIVTGSTTGGLAIPGGTHYSPSGMSDMYVTKFNKTSGAAVWAAQLGTNGADVAPRGIALNGSGGFTVAASTTGGFGVSQEIGTTDGLIVAVDASGNYQWSNELGYTGTIVIPSATAVDVGGNAFLYGFSTGIFDGTAKVGYQDLILTKFSPTGVKQ